MERQNETTRPNHRRMGHLSPDFPSIETLADEADSKLLKSIYQCQTYVLLHLLTDEPISTRSLRVRAHNFILCPQTIETLCVWLFAMSSVPKRVSLEVV